MPAESAFEVTTGDDEARTEEALRRRTAVRAALDGLMQIRRLTNTGAVDPDAVPAPWERHQPVRAVALALEAAGIPPSAVNSEGERVAVGYRVAVGERTGMARVEWLGPHGSGAAYEAEGQLKTCSQALRRLGWEALLYRGQRRRRYLEVEPGPR